MYDALYAIILQNRNTIIFLYFYHYYKTINLCFSQLSTVSTSLPTKFINRLPNCLKLTQNIAQKAGFD